MRKKVSLMTLLLIRLLGEAQVGINATEPGATLDIVAENTDGTTAEGVITSRLKGL